ncbi:MAG: thiamine-phosphate kinase [Chloracidobacterium sp.]|nr:thiamine-phosphate kinase [Chloracidobacterium sp.]MDW8218720.1 thiamine-phosphate kinase [Acidobacteriota bacterium]
MRSERDFVRWLQQRAAQTRSDILLGIGDDAAILTPPPNRQLVVMSDALVEDVHFRRRYVPAEAVGHKALAANLSDCAAMGATPRCCLLSLAIPSDAHAFAEGVVNGLLALADRTQVALVGGDTIASPHGLFIAVTLIGDVAPACAVTRAGARPDDYLFVSGTLGAAAAAFRALEQGLTPPDAAARARFLFPEARLKLGRYLAERQLATAMIDLSDGLSVDLIRLCEASRVGAVLEAEALPVAPAAVAVAGDADGARQLALDGGEDYELLFTVAPRQVPAVLDLRKALAAEGLLLTCIGRITEGPTVALRLADELRPLRAGGYDHFVQPDREGKGVADSSA